MSMTMPKAANVDELTKNVKLDTTANYLWEEGLTEEKVVTDKKKIEFAIRGLKVSSAMNDDVFSTDDP